MLCIFVNSKRFLTKIRNIFIRQRATVLKRHFLAQWRRNQERHFKRSTDVSSEKEIVQNDAASEKESMTSHADVDKKAPTVPLRSTSTSTMTTTSAAQGLARLGSRTALSFAFAFLRRAWRSGEDSDLCSDLLQVYFKYISTTFKFKWSLCFCEGK
jgi:E3 ubiquitin-protein ligase HERC2